MSPDLLIIREKIMDDLSYFVKFTKVDGAWDWRLTPLS